MKQFKGGYKHYLGFFVGFRNLGRTCLPALLCCALSGVSFINAATPPNKTSLAEALAQLQVPPAWFATTQVAWELKKPWKDGRIEIRRLLALDEQAVRQAVKLTWLYREKEDIGDGHEWPMYLFMSGNYAWAAREYPDYLAKVAGKGATHAYVSYASCLAHFGEYDQALNVLRKAAQDPQPKPWRISSLANIENQFGDIYAKMGNVAEAQRHYAEAMRLYPLSDQPYGRHLLHRNVAKIRNKSDLLTKKNMVLSSLPDGTYPGRSMGYADTKEMEIKVTIAAGKITNVDVSHQEKIELGATKIVPQRIVAKQSLDVDGVTGATITSQAIIDGAFQALKKAGLK